MGAGKIGAGTGQLANLSSSMLKQSRAPRKEILGQLTEALRTGGVQAKIPMIQQAVSRANQQNAIGLSQTAEQLAQRNIGGPFASRILAGQRLGGEQASAAIPTQMAQQLIQQMTPFLASTQSLGASGLSQVAQLGQAADMFSAGSVPFSRTGQTGLLGGICLHPDSRIETPTGAVKVKELVPGDIVWSQGRHGSRVPARVVVTVERDAGPDHQFLRVEAPGGPILVSPQHPLADGTPIERVYGGALVTAGSYTCDIQVDGPTGVYCVNGFVLGSTLDARHQRRAA